MISTVNMKRAEQEIRRDYDRAKEARFWELYDYEGDEATLEKEECAVILVGIIENAQDRLKLSDAQSGKLLAKLVEELL